MQVGLKISVLWILSWLGYGCSIELKVLYFSCHYLLDPL